MRLYTAGNFYLSSIQQGIQGAHVLGELFTKYGENTTGGGYYLYDWARNHKTMICLNGGTNGMLVDLYALFTSKENNMYPVAKFHEDDESMGGMLTTVGIILPAKIYDAIPVDNVAGEPVYEGLTPWEIEVVQKIKRMPLAR